MSERTLRDCRILVVEDEYYLADELRTELEDAGAIVLGPVGTINDAVEAITSGQSVHGAILDVNLRGEMVFRVADLLADRRVPFLFTTGYDQSMIPQRFADVVRCEKPINMSRITRAIGEAIHA